MTNHLRAKAAGREEVADHFASWCGWELMSVRIPSSAAAVHAKSREQACALAAVDGTHIQHGESAYHIVCGGSPEESLGTEITSTERVILLLCPRSSAARSGTKHIDIL
jgi:hypothetical protein